jgi:hypothetical protein
MVRETPYRHKVVGHRRKRSYVRGYYRGEGEQKSKFFMGKVKIKQKEQVSK